MEESDEDFINDEIEETEEDEEESSPETEEEPPEEMEETEEEPTEHEESEPEEDDEYQSTPPHQTLPDTRFPTEEIMRIENFSNFIPLSDSDSDRETLTDYSHDAEFGLTLEKLVASAIDPSKPLVSPRLEALLNIEKTIALSKQQPELRDKLLEKISVYKASRFPDLKMSTQDLQEKDIEMDSSQPSSQISDDTPPAGTDEFPDSQDVDTPGAESDSDIVFIDVLIDERSIQLHQISDSPDLSSPLESPVTDRVHISDPEMMIIAIEDHEEDYHTVMNLILDSTIDYTPQQERIIEEIRAEYDVYRVTSRSTHLHNRIQAFAESLASHLLQQGSQTPEGPTEEELAFFEDRKTVYTRVYEVLIRSAFPYSQQQIEFLHSYRYRMDYASGDPDDETDIHLMSDLEGLMNSMANDDHVNDSSPHRFYIDCTIEYHAQKIVSSLGLSCAHESMRVTPASVPEGRTVRTANFVIERLSDTFGTISWEQPRQLFHDGMREVYNRMINIFMKPILTYSDHQKQLIQGILTSIEELSQSTTASTHEDIQLRFYGFMDSLRIDRPKREYIKHDGEYLINPDGFISRTIEDITWELLYLQKVSEDHFESFALHTHRIPNIVPAITRHFLRFYPHYQRIPVSSISGPGSPSFF